MIGMISDSRPSLINCRVRFWKDCVLAAARQCGAAAHCEKDQLRAAIAFTEGLNDSRCAIDSASVSIAR